MQHSTVRTETKWKNPRLILPTRQTRLLGALSVLMGFAIVMTFVFIWIAPAINFNSVSSNARPIPGSALAANTVNPSDGLTTFELYTRNLADSNSLEAFPILIQSLQQNLPLARRSYVLAALKDASPAVVPALIAALNDGDVGVRAGAAQVLGMRHEYQAIAALTQATRDNDAGVRREAVASLGSLGAWEVLPRLDQLEVNEFDYYVREAAIATKELFKKEIAQAIGVLFPELRDLAVTTGNPPQIYAATTSNLYALEGPASWRLVSRLPDAPLAIATGTDPELIYLATVTAGLYRSLDGGETWEHVQFGLRTPTQLSVTAIVVDPQNPLHVYLALAAQGTKPGVKDALGIFLSKNGGATWRSLENSPTGSIAKRLVIDPQDPGYLFGMTSDTPWRYELPVQVCDTCVD